MVATRIQQLRSKAKNLIDKWGENVVLTTSTSSFDPATSENTLTETTSTVKISPPTSPKRRVAEDGDVERATQTRYVDAPKIVPTVGMKFTLDSHVWRILEVDALGAMGDDVLYKLEISR